MRPSIVLFAVCPLALAQVSCLEPGECRSNDDCAETQYCTVSHQCMEIDNNINHVRSKRDGNYSHEWTSVDRAASESGSTDRTTCSSGQTRPKV